MVFLRSTRLNLGRYSLHDPGKSIVHETVLEMPYSILCVSVYHQPLFHADLISHPSLQITSLIYAKVFY